MSIDSIFKMKNFASSLWGKKKKSSHFYKGPVVSFKVLRQARGNNVPPYDSQTVCKRVGWKIKSNHTLYFKNKILEESNQMKDLAFQEATQHKTKPSVFKTKRNEWKQTKTGRLSTWLHWIRGRASERKGCVLFCFYPLRYIEGVDLSELLLLLMCRYDCGSRNNLLWIYWN